MPDSRQPNHDVPAHAVDMRALLGAAVIVLAIALAYANSLSGPFLYDDKPSIVFNSSIRHLWPLTDVFAPPGAGATVSGRPVLNLTFALNFACGGLDVRGYHLVNLAIHTLAALTLFGLTRRTLLQPTMPPALRRAALPSALAVAALWAVHPLQTEAVTYIVQRAESLMSFFYLATLYAFMRSIGSPRPQRWRAAAWLACLLGMGTKENMVSAPIVVLLFDRAFIAGTFVAAWRSRRNFYFALATTWLPLAWLVLSTGGNRNGSAGFGVGIGWAQYAATQFPALARYLALAVWPQPLVFDYGAFLVHGIAEIFGSVLVVTIVVAAILYALWRHPRFGCLGAFALAVLAPTSLIPGTTQMIVEHRMYLPLASMLGLICVIPAFGFRRAATVALTLAVLACIGLTAARNRSYASEYLLWSDTVLKRPENAVAHSTLGALLTDMNRREEAMAEDRRALQLNPEYAPALANLGVALTEAGRPADALPYVARALERQPNNAQAQLNLGVALDMLGRSAEALPHFELAVRLNPLLPAAHNDLGDALSRTGQLQEGVAHLEEAIRLEPKYRHAYFNLAAALVRSGRMAEGQAQFAAGLRLQRDEPSAHVSWATFLLRQGQLPEALSEYEAALRLDPAAPETRYAYGTALAQAERYADATREYEAAIRARPDYAEAHNNLANTLVSMNRVADAIAEYQTALRLRPDDANTHNNLGLALARNGQIRAAATEFETAVRLAPDFVKARDNLARARAQLFEQLNGQ